MPVRQVPGTYWPFVLLTMFGPLLSMVAAGDTIDPSVPGLAFVGLLLFGLARRSVLSWLLLLGWDAFVVVAVVGVSGGTWSLSGVFLLLNGLLSLALLLSPSMLGHLGFRRKRLATTR